MPSAESEVRALLEKWSNAVRSTDIEQMMSLYSPDIVYFDVVPPLRYTGAAALRRDFVRWFDLWNGPIRVEIRDQKVLVSGDVATAFMLHRTSGTLKAGRQVDYWVRATVTCQRFPEGWLIAHEHISLPVDFTSGRAVMDGVP